MNSSPPQANPTPDQSTPPVANSKRRRFLRMGMRFVLVGLAILLLCAAGLWYWLSGQQSLQQVLAIVQNHMPAGSSLQAQGVSGSILQGGHIDKLIYRQSASVDKANPATSASNQQSDAALSLVLEDIDISWNWAALQHRAASLRHLHVRSLSYTDTRPPTTSHSDPLQNLTLPISVDAPFSIDSVHIANPASDKLSLQHITGRYRYEQSQHSLALDSLHWQQGLYQMQGTLGGVFPMPLQLQASAVLPIAKNSSNNSPAKLHIALQLTGTVAEPQGLLQISGTAQTSPTESPSAVASSKSAPPLQATFKTTLHPWKAQPFAQARVQWKNLNVHDFLPDAVQTLLDGELELRPVQTSTPASTAKRAEGIFAALGTDHWALSLQMRNHVYGAWDKGLLPMQHLEARLDYNNGALDIQKLYWQLGDSHIAGQAKYHPQQGWKGGLALRSVNTASLYSTVSAAPLSGQLELRSPSLEKQSAAPVDIDLSLRSDSSSGTLNRLVFEQIKLQGRWQQETFNFSNVLVKTPEALLQGNISYHTKHQDVRTHLQLSAPGAQATLTGQLSASNGKGQLQVHVPDVQKVQAWLQQYSSAPIFRERALSGMAKLNTQWQGGWQARGKNLQLNARLDVPALALQTPTATAAPKVVVRNTLLTATGTLADLRLQGQTQAQFDKQNMRLSMQAQLGLLDKGWQAQVHIPQLHVQNTQATKNWTLQLETPAHIAIRQTGAELHASSNALPIKLDAARGGTAHMLFEPISLLWKGDKYTISSKGTLTNIPLEWINALDIGILRDKGLSGDMALSGAWNVQLGQGLQLQATLQRSSGDIVVLGSGDTTQGKRILAGVRNARLAVRGNGSQLQAQLDWDSANAGNIHALLNTQLTQTPTGWALPASAPLQGRLQAHMPKVGIWNLFTPPGWRLRGTLDANVNINGTLQAPLLYGSLNANELAVRSVVDGFALNNGQLRTRFTGQRMEIDTFSLKGTENSANLLAQGRTAGGSANITGYVAWGGGQATLPQALDIRLKTTLERLQIFSLPQRLLVLSGNVDTHLSNAQLHIRGDLNINRALIDLPEHFAPQLDADVHIRPSKAVATQASNASSSSVVSADSDVVLKSSGTVAHPASAAENTASKEPTKPATERTSSPSSIVPSIDVSIDLGNNFRLRGYGLDTQLNGKLSLQNGIKPSLQPRLTGTIETERGTFRAYGQDLQIDQGRLTFKGSAANPDLDIRAVRPNIEFRVGVHIRGTAQQPFVQLFSDPVMPDSERLSWLVLGRSSGNAADTALLQKAALALLGGNKRGITGKLADALGLDEIDFSGGSANGDSLASGSIKLGKRFNKNVYIAYEKGFDAALGTVYFFYDINAYLKLRGQTGEQSAVDLIYSISYN